MLVECQLVAVSWSVPVGLPVGLPVGRRQLVAVSWSLSVGPRQLVASVVALVPCVSPSRQSVAVSSQNRVLSLPESALSALVRAWSASFAALVVDTTALRSGAPLQPHLDDIA